MYGISSNLASQTANKRNAWACLRSIGLVSGDLSRNDANRMIVEGWAVGIRVVIKKIYKGVEVIKGLSTILSPLKIAEQIVDDTIAKSKGLGAVRKSQKVFLVDSAQDPEQKHTVIAQAYGIFCSCMKFKCLNNRLEREAPQLLEAIGEVRGLVDNQSFCKGTVYNKTLKQFETRVHVQCHHVRVVMKRFFDAYTTQEYLDNYHKVMKEYQGDKRERLDTIPF